MFCADKLRGGAYRFQTRNQAGGVLGFFTTSKYAKIIERERESSTETRHLPFGSFVHY